MIFKGFFKALHHDEHTAALLALSAFALESDLETWVIPAGHHPGWILVLAKTGLLRNRLADHNISIIPNDLHEFLKPLIIMSLRLHYPPAQHWQSKKTRKLA